MVSEDDYDDEYEFGKRRRGRKMAKGKRSITIRGRKRKLYRGKNGGYYYRTRSGKTYIKGRRLRRAGARRRVRRPRRSSFFGLF